MNANDADRGRGLTSDERRARGAAAFERVNSMPAPPPINAFVECGVVGYVFAEVWNRGVLSDRDRRIVALCGAAASAADAPLEAHVWGALSSGDLTHEAFDELVLHVATQYGWPTASVLNAQGMSARRRLAEQHGAGGGAVDIEPLSDPASPDELRRRALETYRAVHGTDPADSSTPFAGAAALDFVYGRLWTRERHLDRRSRRLVAITCAAVTHDESATASHVRAALDSNDLSLDELREVAVHLAVYAGWPVARRLDDTITTSQETSS